MCGLHRADMASARCLQGASKALARYARTALHRSRGARIPATRRLTAASTYLHAASLLCVICKLPACCSRTIRAHAHHTQRPPRRTPSRRAFCCPRGATRVRVSSICATWVRVPSIQGRFPRPDGAEPNPEFADVQTPNPGSRRCPNPEPKISPSSSRRAPGEHLASSRRTRLTKPTRFNPAEPIPRECGSVPTAAKAPTVKTRPHQQPAAPTVLPPRSAAQHVPAAPPPPRTHPRRSPPKSLPPCERFNANRCSQDGRLNDLTGASTGFPALSPSRPCPAARGGAPTRRTGRRRRWEPASSRPPQSLPSRRQPRADAPSPE